VIPDQPKPVKLFCGLLYADGALLGPALEELENTFGAHDFLSPEFKFDVSDYYRAELGWPITRRFASFRERIDPGRLPEIKLLTNAIEERLAGDGRRRVNLDPGYMDFNKVILASAKADSQKIYLGRGIYADPALRYDKGAFRPYPRAFPDFRSGAYNAAFLRMRELYKTA